MAPRLLLFLHKLLIRLRIPHLQQIGLSFPWFPIFDSQGASTGLGSALPGMLPSQAPVSIPSLAYERICVLFNTAAMYMALGVAEPKSDPDSIKRAVGLFQNAAGCFQHLKESALPGLVLPADQRNPCSPDLSLAALQAFSDLCLAQAQECSWQQAVLGQCDSPSLPAVLQSPAFIQGPDPSVLLRRF